MKFVLKEVSNVTNTNNNSSVTVTITYADNTTSQINVLVKQIIPEIFAEPRYTVQGQNFPEEEKVLTLKTSLN